MNVADIEVWRDKLRDLNLDAEELCDLAHLGKLLRDSWHADYFTNSADAHWEARKAIEIAKDEYLTAENDKRLAGFRKRWPGVV